VSFLFFRKVSVELAAFSVDLAEEGNPQVLAEEYVSSFGSSTTLYQLMRWIRIGLNSC
jgi:hypothetical protein